MDSETLVVGEIFTADPRRPFAEAMLVRDGVIVAVGERRDVEGLAGPTEKLPSGIQPISSPSITTRSERVPKHFSKHRLSKPFSTATPSTSADSQQYFRTVG